MQLRQHALLPRENSGVYDLPSAHSAPGQTRSSRDVSVKQISRVDHSRGAHQPGDPWPIERPELRPFREHYGGVGLCDIGIGVSGQVDALQIRMRRRCGECGIVSNQLSTCLPQQSRDGESRRSLVPALKVKPSKATREWVSESFRLPVIASRILSTIR